VVCWLQQVQFFGIGIAILTGIPPAGLLIGAGMDIGDGIATGLSTSHDKRAEKGKCRHSHRL
jgi:hypothetical protein